MVKRIPRADKLRVGFAGAGAISQYHLVGWSEMPDAQVVAICDIDEAKARAKAQAFNIPNVYTDFRTMIESEKLDAVDIVTPVGTHAALTRLAADAGLHVSCQKPLTPTVREAEELIAYVGERVRFMVHENYRFRPHYVMIREWLEQGRVGEITQARMTVRCQGMIEVDGVPPFLLNRQPYLKDFTRLLIFEVLIHNLDAMRVLLGPLEVVAAQVAKVNRELAGEDAAVVLLKGDRRPHRRPRRKYLGPGLRPAANRPGRDHGHPRHPDVRSGSPVHGRLGRTRRWSSTWRRTIRPASAARCGNSCAACATASRLRSIAWITWKR